ncbi:MAG: hypothetical protein RLZZ65_1704 [Bacteroidota bacterium]
MHLLSSISLWWSIPILALSVLLSWGFYRKESWLDKKSKVLKNSLIALRASLIGLIGLLLLGLTMEFMHFETEDPIVVTLIDQSSSMLNDEKAPQLEAKLQQFEAELNQKFKNGFRIEKYYFGSNLTTQHNGFSDPRTNMEKAFEEISTHYFSQNLGAVVLISDGNYNVGAHPVYQAEHLSLTPIYTLGVGDTTLKKDQILKNVSYNELTFLNNEFPIEVDVEAYRLAGKSCQLTLFEDGKKIEEKIISYEKGLQSNQTHVFQLNAKKKGIRAYRIQLSPLKGEFSLQNNSKTVYIEVIDTKNNILLLSAAPHPDLSAISQALKGNENYTLSFKTPIEVKGKLNTYDLVIWHEPSVGFDKTILAELKNQKISTWFILGTQADQATIKQLPLGINFSTRQQLEEVQAYTENGFALFEPDESWTKLLSHFPPLQKRFGESSISGNTQVLLKQQIGSIQKNDPLLSFSEINGQRSACLNGEGIWRWKLQAFQKTQRHDAFQSLIAQISSYLMVKQEGMGLRVEAPYRLDTDQEFILNASFYNASLQAIVSPELKWELKNEKGLLRKGELGVKGLYYQQNLGKLKPGTYSWKVSSTFNGKPYVKTGNIIVEAIDLERLESAARHSTLKQLSKQSGGAFQPLSNYAKLIDQIEANDALVAVRTERHQFDELNDLIGIFFILLILVSTEWFLRRFNGAY